MCHNFVILDLDWWFSTRGDFVSGGHLAMSGDIFGRHNLWSGEEGVHLEPLVGRGQGCYETSCNAQDSLVQLAGLKCQ